MNKVNKVNKLRVLAATLVLLSLAATAAQHQVALAFNDANNPEQAQAHIGDNGLSSEFNNNVLHENDHCDLDSCRINDVVKPHADDGTANDQNGAQVTHRDIPRN